MENTVNINFGRFDSCPATRMQWDKGQAFYFADNLADGTEVQFSDGTVRLIKDCKCSIPDKVLQSAGDCKVYVQVIGENNETTIKTIDLKVKPRAKKNDYVEPEDEPTFREEITTILNDTKAVADSVRADADAGKFNGDDYILTDEDKQEIAELVDTIIPDTVTSKGCDFAEVGVWNDGNPDNEDRLYRFVTIVGSNKEIDIANSTSQIVGTSNLKDNVGFLSGYTKGCENDKSKVVVSIIGVVRIKTTDDTIVAGDRVMSDDNGFAVKSTNNLGYRVLSVKNGLLTIVISPNTDMIQRIKNDMMQKIDDVKVNGESAVADGVANVTVPTSSTDLEDSDKLIRDDTLATYSKPGLMYPGLGLLYNDKTGLVTANIADIRSNDGRIYITHGDERLYNFELRNIPTTQRVAQAERDIIANEEEIDKLKEAVAQLHSFTAKVVDTLPDVGEDGILYLVSKDKKSSGNIYNEYLWIDSAYELIGDTAVDLSDYVTTEKLTQSLSGKQDSLSDEQIQSIADVPNKANKADIPTATSQLKNDSNFVSDNTYVHTDNNFTTAEKEKLKSLSNYDDSNLQAQIDDLKIFEKVTSNLYVKDVSAGGHLYYNPVEVRYYFPNGSGNTYVTAPIGSFCWVDKAENGNITSKIIAANSGFYITVPASTNVASIKYLTFITMDDVNENHSVITYSGKKILGLIENLQKQIDELKGTATANAAETDSAVNDLMMKSKRAVVTSTEDTEIPSAENE